MSIMLQYLARLLLLPILVTALAFLAKGYDSTGDGFSAGLVASLGLLLQYVAFGHRHMERVLPVRKAPKLGLAGLAAAMLGATLPTLFGKPPLGHVPGAGQHVPEFGVLKAHSALLFDAGVFTLVVGFTLATIDVVARRARRP